jgi:uncharacterized Zn finger protein
MTFIECPKCKTANNVRKCAALTKKGPSATMIECPACGHVYNQKGKKVVSRRQITIERAFEADTATTSV